MEYEAEYAEFLGKKVHVITTARMTDANSYNVGDSMRVAGVLTKESETNITLSDMSIAYLKNTYPIGKIRKEQLVMICEYPT